MATRISQAGFTLAEMVTVLAVIAIVAVIATAGLSGIVRGTRVQTTVRKLHQDLQLARTAAVTRSRLVTVCPLDASHRCSRDWSRPISVFLDPGNARALSKKRYLLDVVPHPDQIRLEVRPARKRYFQFSSTGLVHGTLGSVLICGGRPGVDRAAYMAINMGGRVRELWDRDGDGRIKTRYGKVFECGSAPTD